MTLASATGTKLLTEATPTTFEGRKPQQEWQEIKNALPLSFTQKFVFGNRTTLYMFRRDEKEA